jgi:hypothetical protein
MFEDELVPFLEQFGEIYELRIMMMAEGLKVYHTDFYLFIYL